MEFGYQYFQKAGGAGEVVLKLTNNFLFCQTLLYLQKTMYEDQPN
jgi:hypothetical protein